MIEKTIAEIEAGIRGEAIADDRKRELLRLLGTLRAEVAEKPPTLTREKQKSLKRSVDELRTSVEGFEQSHPKLVETVNSISQTLSNLGI